jgi:hypothetical protein
VQLAAEQGERCFTGVPSRVQRNGKTGGDALEDRRVGEQLLALPQPVLRSVRKRVLRLESKQLAAM